ncbi:AAA family ATPase [Xanthocytophaga agilis]|uniref:AAA family ATPase n=1 Tax=Xanthocytophaga agilis TaxID=3048010 RepID=A0AAE3R5I9_9BACT|nr:AAA family ATPase [Xanthocytophaga agilis]MDJ1501987.1 AAA family ATPase [Xanthocytophaga agilis]
MQDEFSRRVSQFRNEQMQQFSGQINGQFNSKNEFRNEFTHSTAAVKQSIEITLAYQVRNTKPALSIGESKLINKGEFVTVIGAPGSGKSNLIEDLMAGFICHVTNTPYPHSLVDFHYPAATADSRGLFIDFERPLDDVACSLGRTLKRVSINESLIRNNRFRNVEVRSMLELETAEQKRSEIRLLLTESLKQGAPFDYLILDGCLDLTTDMNDSKDAVLVVRWIRKLASEFNLAIICTLHPNKNTTTAAGHFGSFLHRYSRAFLLLQMMEQADGMRQLTSDFDMGKLSHSHLPVEQYFKWDARHHFFVSAAQPQVSKNGNTIKLKEVIHQVFTRQMSTQIPSADFKRLLLEVSAQNESKVKRLISEAVEFGYIRLEGERNTGMYYLTSSTD